MRRWFRRGVRAIVDEPADSSGYTQPSRIADAVPVTTADERLERLRIVQEELTRQRDATAAKHRDMRARATLVIGAATIVTGVQAPRVPNAIRAVTDSTEPSLWEGIAHWSALSLAAVATVTAVLAAIAGIRTVWVERGGEIDARKLATNVLDRDPDTYTVEWSLLRDRLDVHDGDVTRLEDRRRIWSRGAVLLVVSWITTILQFGISTV